MMRIVNGRIRGRLPAITLTKEMRERLIRDRRREDDAFDSEEPARKVTRHTADLWRTTPQCPPKTMDALDAARQLHREIQDWVAHRGGPGGGGMVGSAGGEGEGPLPWRAVSAGPGRLAERPEGLARRPSGGPFLRHRGGVSPWRQAVLPGAGSSSAEHDAAGLSNSPEPVRPRNTPMRGSRPAWGHRGQSYGSAGPQGRHGPVLARYHR